VFWSPNSQYVGYVQQEDAALKLMRVPAAGGQSITLCDLPGRAVFGAAWSSRGMIVLGMFTSSADNGALYQVSDQSGALEPFLMPDSTAGERICLWPHFLPNGRDLLFSTAMTDSSVTLMAWKEGRKTVLLRERNLWRHGYFVPVFSPEGYVVYSTGVRNHKSIWAAPFSLSDMTVTGDRVLIEQNGSEPSVSRDGDLVYKSTTPPYENLAWVDRQGNTLEEDTQYHEVILNIAVSSDDRRVAVAGANEGQYSLYVHDIGQARKNRIVFDRISEPHLTWAPGDTAITFTNDPKNASALSVIAQVRTDGQSRIDPIAADTSWYFMTPHWSKDGNYLVYTASRHVDDSRRFDDNIHFLDARGANRPNPFLNQEGYNERNPVFSPDGRYVAYVSNETGRDEVFVTTFPHADRKWMVSPRGGAHPEWSVRGDDLFYVESNTLMSVKVQTGNGFQFATPEALFDGGKIGATLNTREARYAKKYAVSRDGARILVIRSVPEGEMHIRMVENWAKEHRKDLSRQ
jgi:Tol biopolymer transport system component